MKELAGKLGKLIFPDVEEKKSRRIMVQIITGLSIVLISIEGMLVYSRQEVKQQQKFQQIKGEEITLPEVPPAIPEGKETGTAKEGLAEADSGEEQGDMGEIDTNTVIIPYNWDSLMDANADVKGR